MGFSNRGIGGGLGPLSMGYGFRRSVSTKPNSITISELIARIVGTGVAIGLTPVVVALFDADEAASVFWFLLLLFVGWGAVKVLFVVLDSLVDTWEDERLASTGRGSSASPRHAWLEFDDEPSRDHEKRNRFRFAPGDRLDHIEFGPGVVMQVSYTEFQIAAVKFDDGSLRRVNVAFDPVTPEPEVRGHST